MYRKEQSFVIYVIEHMGGGRRGLIQPLIFKISGKCQSSSPGRITPNKEVHYPLNRRNVDPIHCVRLGGQKNICPSQDWKPGPSRPQLSHFTDRDTPA